MIANRIAAKGDQTTGMVVMNRKGETVWAGEFYATVGEGKIADFAAGCNRAEVSTAYIILEDETVALIDLGFALNRNL